MGMPIQRTLGNSRRGLGMLRFYAGQAVSIHGPKAWSAIACGLPRRSSNGSTALRVQHDGSAGAFFSLGSGQPVATLVAAFYRYSQLTFPSALVLAAVGEAETLPG